MKNLKIFTLTSMLVIGLTLMGFSQTNNIPAPPQSQGIALVGATLHLGNGTVIEQGTVVFDGGKITAVGTSSEVSIPEGFQIFELQGREIYPGFFLPATNMGLVEVSAVRATDDGQETGVFNPNIRSLVAYNTDSELPPTMRYNGILMAQIAPSGGVVAGSSSIVQLDAWNWEDAAYKVDNGMHLYWPNKMMSARWWMGETQARPNENYQPTVDEIQKTMKEAKAFAEGEKEVTNLKLEALAGLFDGSKTLFIHTNNATAIIESASIAKELGVQKIAIVGGEEALLVADFLKSHRIPVVLGDVHALPNRDHEDTVHPYKLPALLHEAGVEFCFGFSGRMTARARNLPFYAGTAVAYGLPYEEGVKALTSTSAKILGVGETCGTIAVGKDATLFVSQGDALDMRSNQMEYVFIQGRKVQLEATQQELYKKYSNKYGHQID
jgi:imidazolonepropionase-like amidohydrolase